MLIDRKTIHSALQSLAQHLGEKGLAEMRKIFSEDVVLVVVDEMSMLSAEFLVLLDERMRRLYSARLIFGGMSILLSGDFLQMKRVFGTDLCDAICSPFQLSAKS